MKLKTKLIIVFIVVMIFPIIFARIAMHAFVPGKARDTADVSDRSIHHDSIFNLMDLSDRYRCRWKNFRKLHAISKKVILTLRSRQNQYDEIGLLCQDLKKCVLD